jgi:hypothetical protein
MELLSGSSILVYLLIFFGKIIEVTLDTVRMVLATEGAPHRSIMGLSYHYLDCIVSLCSTLSGEWIKCAVLCGCIRLG